MKSACFISYSRAQSTLAARLQNDLEGLGVSSFISDNIVPGDEWAKRIQKALHEAGVFVVLVSPESMSSSYVLEEFAMAHSAEKKIVPSVLFSAHQPPLLRARQAIQLEPFSKNGYDELIQVICGRCGVYPRAGALERITAPDPPRTHLPRRLRAAIEKATGALCMDPYSLLGLCHLSQTTEFSFLVDLPTQELRTQAFVELTCSRRNPDDPILGAAELIASLKGLPSESIEAGALAEAAQMVEEHEAGLAKQNSKNVSGVEQAYLQWLLQTTRPQLSGRQQGTIFGHDGAGETYVRQKAIYSVFREKSQEFQDSSLDRHEAPLLDVVQVAEKYGFTGAGIVGPAGCGKSTTIHELVSAYSRGEVQSRFPLFLSLKSLSRKWKPLPASLSLFAAACGQAQFDLSFFERQLARPRGCLVLFDGLDEVDSTEDRPKVVAWILDNKARYPKCFVLLTSRDHVFTELAPRLKDDFLRMDVCSFSHEDIEQFIRSWYLKIQKENCSIAGRQIIDDVEREVKRLFWTLSGRPSLMRLALNPLMLQAIVLVDFCKGSVPDRRSDIYRECIGLLAYWLDLERGLGWTKLDEDSVLSLLWSLGRWLHAEEERDRCSYQEAVSALENDLNEILALPIEVPSLLSKVVDRGAVLTTFEEGKIGFRHLAFQEHLAASAMVSRAELPDLVKVIDRPWWREVILLGLEHRMPSPFPDFMRALIQSGAFEQNRAFILDCVRASEGSARPVDDLIRCLLDRSATFDARYTALMVLREIGMGRRRDKVLAEFANGEEDDTRLAYLAQLLLSDATHGHWTDDLPPTWRNPNDGMQFTLVPEGIFTMGAADTDKLWQETPVRTVHLSSFYIAIHPVTNRQYSAFLRDTGFRWPQGKESWNRWVGPDYPPGMDNHPVVCVTWHDARKYCTWSCSQLPTEAQWEKAARGKDGRSFPWGNNRGSPERFLNFEGRMGRTSAVGSYPDGVSPYGCLDMAGNVWEWCEDYFSPGAYRDTAKVVKDPRAISPTGRRVDRGGGWQMDFRRCRTVYRGGWPAGAPDSDLGFRTVVSVQVVREHLGTREEPVKRMPQPGAR